jgi:hypothetical protein
MLHVNNERTKSREARQSPLDPFQSNPTSQMHCTCLVEVKLKCFLFFLFQCVVLLSMQLQFLFHLCPPPSPLDLEALTSLLVHRLLRLAWSSCPRFQESRTR